MRMQGRGRWSLAGVRGGGRGVRQGSAADTAFEAGLKFIKVVGETREAGVC